MTTDQRGTTPTTTDTATTLSPDQWPTDISDTGASSDPTDGILRLLGWHGARRFLNRHVGVKVLWSEEPEADRPEIARAIRHRLLRTEHRDIWRNNPQL